MSLKVHFNHSQLDPFRGIFGVVSEEQAGILHQDIKKMENRFNGRLDTSTMDDYAWVLKCDDSNKYTAGHGEIDASRRSDNDSMNSCLNIS